MGIPSIAGSRTRHMRFGRKFRWEGAGEIGSAARLRGSWGPICPFLLLLGTGES